MRHAPREPGQIRGGGGGLACGRQLGSQARMQLGALVDVLSGQGSSVEKCEG